MMASGRAPSTAARTLRASVRSMAISPSERVPAGGPWPATTASPQSRKYLQRCRPTKPFAPVTRTRTLPDGRLQAFQVGVDHQFDQLLESHFRLPSEIALRLVRVADEHVHFGRPHECGIDEDVLLPVDADAREGDLAEFTH